jgi:purine-nucleoside phosphorylase
MAESQGVATGLDDAVLPAAEALAAVLPAPHALYLLGTGLGALASELASVRRASLGEVPGVPHSWREQEIVAGELGKLVVWAILDAPGPSELGSPLDEKEPAWTRGFPCWLARARGAEVCVHSSAGTSLLAHGAERAPPVGSLALVSDHVNFSGGTPLVGLGVTRLGPLFPDVTRLHDAVLRRAALAAARARGIAASEAIAACTTGPSLDTPAELAFFARAGASIAVQGLAAPLLAAAHAGLAVLALSAITDGGDEPLDLARILARADAIAPALDEILLALAAPIAARAAELKAARE